MARVVFPPGAPPPLWTHYNPISSKEFRGEPESLHIPPLCLVYYRLWATFRYGGKIERVDYPLNY